MMTKRDWLETVMDAMGGAARHHPDLGVVRLALNKLTARELAALERIMVDSRANERTQAVLKKAMR